MYKTNSNIQWIGTGIGLLGLRLFLAWEFLNRVKKNGRAKTGLWKYKKVFLSHSMSSQAILIGHWQWGRTLITVLPHSRLFTRCSALSLTILTAVAWYSVHAGAGYNVCNNGYKMALIYIVTLLPLITQGAGIFSVNHLLQRKSPTLNQ